MDNCEKCSRTTIDCSGRNGGRNTHGIVGRLTCYKCDDTGPGRPRA